MAISTKKGDSGYTDIYQKRVKKNEPIISLLGTIDEAIAVVVIAQTVTKLNELEAIVSDLSLIASILSGYKEEKDFSKECITSFEKEIELFGSISSFSYPFDNYPAAVLNHTRTIIRRLEREYITYSEDHDFSEIISKYLNRLSDYLFVLEFKSFRY